MIDQCSPTTTGGMWVPGGGGGGPGRGASYESLLVWLHACIVFKQDASINALSNAVHPGAVLTKRGGGQGRNKQQDPGARGGFSKGVQQRGLTRGGQKEGPPAQDFCSGIILVDLDIITYCIGCIKAHNASHLQLLVVHNVLQDQHTPSVPTFTIRILSQYFSYQPSIPLHIEVQKSC